MFGSHDFCREHCFVLFVIGLLNCMSSLQFMFVTVVSFVIHADCGEAKDDFPHCAQVLTKPFHHVLSIISKLNI